MTTTLDDCNDAWKPNMKDILVHKQAPCDALAREMQLQNYVVTIESTSLNEMR